MQEGKPGKAGISGKASHLTSVGDKGSGLATQTRGIGRRVAWFSRQCPPTPERHYISQRALPGLSPHFIPHRSQHAISGTISQALKIHGPNFGAGGGPGAAAEALLAGAVLLEGSRLPGVWVVLTGWDPEYVPDPEGRPTCETTCQ